MNPRSSSFSPLSLVLAVMLLAALAACGAPSEGHVPEKPAGQTVGVDVAPPSATVAATGTVAFAATVTGTQNTNVTWSLDPAGCGSLSGTGVFTAPGAAATCRVVATADADPTKTAAAVVTVTDPPPPPPPPPPVAVTISPASAALNGCGTQTFTATVTGTTNTAVTWAVQEGAAGGAITPQGVYTAPSGAGTYHAVATSVADGTKVATAAIVVSEKVLSVTVSPPNITLTAGGTAQFTATVTTTCGSVQTTKTITAPRTAAAR